MKKRIGIFLFFLVFATNLFANNNNVLNDDFIAINTDMRYNNKIKINILKPCLVVKKVKNISDDNVNDNSDSNNDEINNIHDNVNNKSDNLENFNKKVTEIDELLNSLDDDEDKNAADKDDKDDEDDRKIIEYKEKENQIFFTDNYLNDKNKKNIENIYNKMINNLNITGLYDITYTKNSCENINTYFKEQQIEDISDYIFSEDLNSYDYVINTEIKILNETEIKLQLFIWDILDEKFIDGKYYILKIEKDSNSYRISNLISDFIFKTLTGEKSGFFDSKIIYVSETGAPLKRDKQIAIMNFDGSKNVKITHNKNLKLTPIFSKYNPNEIFYLEYLKEGPFIIRYNLEDNKITKISTKNQKMTSAATFNPNNKNQIILSGTDSGGTNLFLFDFDKKTNKQLTAGTNINTAASFNPDGTKIVYVSDKSGSRKLYIKDLETNKDTLITDKSGVYDKPAWSPDGKLITFIKIMGGKFYLGIMTYEGEAERLLIGDYLIEGVKWSPNSRYVIYTKQKGPYGEDSIPRLYMMDIVNKNEYKLNTPKYEGASDPDWLINY